MADLLIPDWPAPATVGAFCTTRTSLQAAHSAANPAASSPFADSNVALHVGDDALAVGRRRAQLADLSCGAVYLRQVCGSTCLSVGTAQISPLPAAQQSPDVLAADAATTTATQVACCVLVADCLPVLFCSTDGKAIAAAHAGWRGLAGGVLENTLALMLAASAAPGLAWLGPCIGAEAFEVGAEVVQALSDHGRHPVVITGHSPRGRPLLDLAATARARLKALGIACYGNDSSQLWCTYSHPARFYSHRYATQRQQATGRLAALIWKKSQE